MPSDGTRAAVERELARPRRIYDFEVREREVPNDPDHFERGRELAGEGWLGDAGAFVTGGDGRALFVRHRDAPGAWGIPGGGHEPGEGIDETARCEVREATGVTCRLAGVWNADRRLVSDETDPDRRFHVLRVHSDAVPEGEAAVDVGDDEILAARWFDEPPEAGVLDFLEPRVEEWADE